MIVREHREKHLEKKMMLATARGDDLEGVRR
jgi:hypothetical protein